MECSRILAFVGFRKKLCKTTFFDYCVLFDICISVRVDTAVPGVDTTALTGGEPVGEERAGGGGRMERREERRLERPEEQAAVPSGPPVAAAAGVGAAGQVWLWDDVPAYLKRVLGL